MLSKYKKIVRDNLEDRTIEALLLLKQTAEKLSPTDTHTFIKKHKIESIEYRDWKLIGTLSNDVDYAKTLEEWYKWQTKPFKYHKWPPTDDSTVFYKWIWSNTYWKTVKENINNVYNIIKKWII